MSIILSLITILFLSAPAFAKEESFMQEFYDSQSGSLLNIMAPCDPGCYAEIKIGEIVISAPTSGIDWEKLYALEDEKDNSVTLNYSRKRGVYITHSSTNAIFSLNGRLEKNQHPIDFALSNCYSKPEGQTTMGMVSCLRGAEDSWDSELNRVYRMLGGSSNTDVKSAQLAWISYRDAQFHWFNSFFDSKLGSKWSYGVGKRRVLLIRQQVEHLQSFYAGY
jgi:uncharacterized protein YecT (DUF1311 family)